MAYVHEPKGGDGFKTAKVILAPKPIKPNAAGESEPSNFFLLSPAKIPILSYTDFTLVEFAALHDFVAISTEEVAESIRSCDGSEIVDSMSK